MNDAINYPKWLIEEKSPYNNLLLWNIIHCYIALRTQNLYDLANTNSNFASLDSLTPKCWIFWSALGWFFNIFLCIKLIKLRKSKKIDSQFWKKCVFTCGTQVLTLGSTGLETGCKPVLFEFAPRSWFKGFIPGKTHFYLNTWLLFNGVFNLEERLISELFLNDDTRSSYSPKFAKRYETHVFQHLDTNSKN